MCVSKIYPARLFRSALQRNGFRNRFRRRRQESTAKSLIVIESVLEDARDFRLDAEVVLYAMMYMRDNPDCQISEAMIAGYNEWVK